MAELLKLVNDSQISKVQLEMKHVEQLINALEYDGKVEKLRNPKPTSVRKGFSSLRFTHSPPWQKQDEILLKPTRISLPFTGLTSVPCGTCPVFDMCSDGGDINPKTCKYLSDWLDF